MDFLKFNSISYAYNKTQGSHTSSKSRKEIARVNTHTDASAVSPEAMSHREVSLVWTGPKSIDAGNRVAI